MMKQKPDPRLKKIQSSLDKLQTAIDKEEEGFVKDMLEGIKLLTKQIYLLGYRDGFREGKRT